MAKGNLRLGVSYQAWNEVHVRNGMRWSLRKARYDTWDSMIGTRKSPWVSSHGTTFVSVPACWEVICAG